MKYIETPNKSNNLTLEDLKSIKLSTIVHEDWMRDGVTIRFKAETYVYRGWRYPDTLRYRKFGCDFELTGQLLKDSYHPLEDHLWEQAQQAMLALFKRRKFLKRRCNWEEAETEFKDILRKLAQMG